MNTPLHEKIKYSNTYHLKHLFYLRNLFILAQFVTVIILVIFFDNLLQASLFSLLIVSLIVFNFSIRKNIKSNADVSDDEIFHHLLIDVASLTFVLYLTGGASNPFITLFIFPLIISVTILPARFAWVLAMVTILSYTFLMFQYQAIHIGHTMVNDFDLHLIIDDFNLHIVGMWMAFAFSAALISHFVVKMGETIRTQEELLVKAREDAMRDRQIIELGTLAASTAHELGTPLGTMNLLVSEIKSELPDVSDRVKSDLDTLKLQIDRCKESLINLSVSAGAINVSSGYVGEYHWFLKSVFDAWQFSRPKIKIKTNWREIQESPNMLHDRTLIQAIINILDNAADVSPNDVEWQADWGDEVLLMNILDRGDGFPESAKPQLGNSSKKVNSNNTVNGSTAGLGIGLFLSHAIIENFGGKVRVSDRKGGGTITHITLPLILNN